MTGIYPQFPQPSIKKKTLSTFQSSKESGVTPHSTNKLIYKSVGTELTCTQMSGSFPGPAGVWFYLSSFHFFRGHDNNSGILLEHHPPEIIHRVLQAALGSNVTFFWLWVVALGFKFRLEEGKTTQQFNKWWQDSLGFREEEVGIHSP